MIGSEPLDREQSDVDAVKLVIETNRVWGMRRLLTTVGAIAFIGLILTGSSLAGDKGGDTIAGAPALPIGTPFVSGALKTSNNYPVEFFKVPLLASDVLTMNYGATNTYGLNVEVYPPKTTDYTLDQAEYFLQDSSVGNGKHQTRFVAPTAGSYVLRFWTASGPSIAYEMTATVRHFTRTTVLVPNLVPANKALTVRGLVKGTSGGKVAVIASAKGFKKSGIATLTAKGGFVYKFTAGDAGTYRISVRYYGDKSHLPSKTSVTVQVA